MNGLPHPARVCELMQTKVSWSCSKLGAVFAAERSTLC